MFRVLVASGLLVAIPAGVHADEPPPNPFIDYATFQQNAFEVAELRRQRRVSEEEFIRLAAEPDTVVLDARSAEMFRRLHVKGAKNLSFPDITAEELKKVIPSKSTRILIYCNNNFMNAPRAFPTKAFAASLNIHTFNALYNYGYTNVYELGPLINIQDAKLEFAGEEAPRDGA